MEAGKGHELEEFWLYAVKLLHSSDPSSDHQLLKLLLASSNAAEHAEEKESVPKLESIVKSEREEGSPILGPRVWNARDDIDKKLKDLTKKRAMRPP